MERPTESGSARSWIAVPHRPSRPRMPKHRGSPAAGRRLLGHAQGVHGLPDQVADDVLNVAGLLAEVDCVVVQ